MNYRLTVALSVLIMAGYGITLALLKRSGAINGDAVVTGVTIIVGWLLTLLMAWLHLQKTHEDNRKIAIAQRKEDLRLNALKEVLKATQDYSSAVGSIWVSLSGLPSRLSAYPPDLQRREAEKAAIQDLPQFPVDLMDAHAAWGFTIEAHELTLQDLEHYRLYLHMRVQDRFHELVDLSTMAPPLLSRALNIPETFDELADLFKPVIDNLCQLQAHLHDFRVLLLNSSLGNLLESKVPPRVPRDPKYARLEDLATKEAVDQEIREREQNAGPGQSA